MLAACSANAPRPVTHSPCLQAATAAPPGFVVGYGEGHTLVAAKQQAFASVAEQIQVNIRSQTESEISKSGQQAQVAFNQRIRTQANTALSELTLQCLDKTSQPGLVAVALGKDFRPLAQQMTDALQANGRAPIQWQAPTAIAQSALLSEVTQRVNTEAIKTLPTKAVTAALHWQPELFKWQLWLNDTPFTIAPDQLGLAVNWAALHTGPSVAVAAVDINGELLNRHIAEQTEYRLALKSEQPGYGQLIGVFENADIQLARHNLPLQAGKVHTVPETGGVFEAAKLNGHTTTDTWLLIVTQQPLAPDALPALNQADKRTQLNGLLGELETLGSLMAVEQLVVK